MQRIFELFHKEFKSVREAAFLLALATMASNLLGLFRDRLLASRFGAGTELDIYYAAFRVPDILYALSLLFVASTAIIPLLLEKRSISETDAAAFLQTVFVAFFVCMGALVVVAYLVLPFVMPFLVPGFSAEARAEALSLSRILLISPFFLGLSNAVSGVLQSFHKFAAYAASFLFYNLGIIGGIIFFVPRFGLRGLAWGVVLGALLHVGIQIPGFMRIGYISRIAMPQKEILSQVFRRSFPRAVGLATSQGILLVVTALASTLGAGSIAVFQFAYNLQSIPLAVVGLSYSVAAFPTMAESIVKKEHTVFLNHLLSTTRHIIFWTLPVSVLFIVLRAHIVRVALGVGEFSWADTRLTSASLALFALGIVAQSLIALFVRALYAIGNTRAPVIINLVCAVFTSILAVVFVRALAGAEGISRLFSGMLRVGGVENHAVLGLPLAFAVGSLVNVFWLGLILTRIEGEFMARKLSASFLEILSASLLLGLVSYGVLQVTSPLFDFNRFWGIFPHGLIAGCAGIAVAVFFLKRSGNAEFREVRDVISHKFWRKETIGPEQEHL